MAFARSVGLTGPARVLPSRAIPGYTRTVGAYARSLPGAIEKKYLDIDITNAGDMSAGVIDSLNLIPAGTSDVTRVGHKVTLKNVNLHFTLTRDDAGTSAPNNLMMRLILLIDKQANGALPAVTDVLKTADINSFRNLDQAERFVILKDKLYNVANTSSNGAHTNDCGRTVRMSKLLNTPVHFSSTTGAITEIKSDNLCLLIISEDTLNNITGTARTKFIDL